MKEVGIFNTEEYISNKGMCKGASLSDDDLSRPIIGIANSFNEMVPGHNNLRTIAQYVKNGVYRGGGTPVEFGTIAICDGIATGHAGGNYVLPSRDNIADSIEIQAKAHKFNGLVLIASCDKIVPGMIMAAARLNIPCILINGGCMLSGGPFRDVKNADASTVTKALGMYQAGLATMDEVQALTTTCVPSSGSCQFYGTANTMCCISEALGLSLPGTAAIPAPYNERLRASLEIGVKIVELVQKDITSGKILTLKSIENAIIFLMATGGSTNAVIHMCAIAYELGISPSEIIDLIDDYSKKIPAIANIFPASQYDMEDFYYAGGVPAVMKELKTLLYGDCMTVSGKTLEDNLNEYKFLYPANKDLIRSLDNPHDKLGGIAIMRGNLAPNTGVSKPLGIHEDVRQFVGKAICFDSEEECTLAISQNKINPGHVVVVRYEGPKGGPGMREMFKASKMLDGQGLARFTAVITDGRFSGTNSGCFVGHISPEAAAGGPIALVQDGDEISIDVINRKLELHVSEAELVKRRESWSYTPKKLKGVLARYAKLAKSADQGGVLE